MKKFLQLFMASFIVGMGIFILSGNKVYAAHTGVVSNVGHTAYDAQATINTPFYPITYYPSWSCNYTMIQNGQNNTWAQVGWSTENDNFYGSTLNGTYYFFQYMDPTLSNPYTVFSAVGPAVNSSHVYITMLDQTTYYGTVDNVQIGSHPAGFYGSYAEYSGEVSDDSMARFDGAYSNGEYMWNVYSAYMNGSTKVWNLSPPIQTWATESSYGKIYEGSWVVGDQNASFNYWDTRN